MTTAEEVQRYALQHLRPVRTAHDRLVIPSGQLDAVHAQFGTRPVDYLTDAEASLVGDAISAVAARLLAAAEEVPR